MNHLKLTYYASISEGKMKLSDRKRFDEEIRAFEGKRIEITIQKAKKRRSLNQNAYLFGVVYPCALQGFLDAGNEGISIEDVHELFKSKYLKEGKDIVLPKTGEVATVRKSTATLSTFDMNIYIEQIAKFCAEYFGIVVPQPLPLFPVEQ